MYLKPSYNIDHLAILQKSQDRAISLYDFIREVRESGETSIAIDDCAKDGGEEFFTEMHCIL